MIFCLESSDMFRSWSMKCGTNHYARLMEKYPSVTSIFLRLPKAHQQVFIQSTIVSSFGLKSSQPECNMKFNHTVLPSYYRTTGLSICIRISILGVNNGFLNTIFSSSLWQKIFKRTTDTPVLDRNVRMSLSSNSFLWTPFLHGIDFISWGFIKL